LWKARHGRGKKMYKLSSRTRDELCLVQAGISKKATTQWCFGVPGETPQSADAG